MRVLKMTSVLCLVLISIRPALASQCSADQLPFPEPEKLTLLSDDFLFLEGPTWSHSQNKFYFSEMDFSGPQLQGPDATVYSLSLTGHIDIFIEQSGTNGLLADKDGLLAMTHNSQSLSIFDWQTKTKTIIANEIKGKAFNSPNDLVKHSQGHIFFTDPDWQLGQRQSETEITGVYRVDRKSRAVTLIDQSLRKPNGIMLSLDESNLFVGDVDGNINHYELDKKGNLIEKADVFARVKVPDGMALDCADNLYVASHSEGAVYVFSNEGKQIQKLDVGPQTTNIAFGGADKRTLLITTGKGLFSIKTSIAGVDR